MPDSIIAAAIQMCSKDDVEQNLALAEALCRRAQARGAALLVLPENFNYIGKMSTKQQLAESLDDGGSGRTVSAMRALATELGVYVLLGGIPLASHDPSRFFNAAILLTPQGAIRAVYRKIHLFDLQVPSGPAFHESEHVLAGNEIVTCEVLGATLGLSICYDLRFPELYRELARRGADIVAVPAAFTLHTGKDHWFPLLRARAIENQCYILAAAQAGEHVAGRASYGKACIIDPWGAVIAQAPEGDSIAVAELDLDYLQRIRRDLPCLDHRRL